MAERFEFNSTYDVSRWWSARSWSPEHPERMGQFLMNRLPKHIYEYVTGDALLDCFHQNEKAINLLRFVNLVWDIEPDSEQYDLAREMVMEEAA